ncbi:hypothetical protein P7K49_002869, partial [Saguinus oedipus]
FGTIPGPYRRFPSFPDRFPASLRQLARRRRRLPRGNGPAPSTGRHRPPSHRLPRGLESYIPVPPSLFLSPRLPAAATVAGRRIPASQLVPASRPSSPQINSPPHALGARTAPFLPRTACCEGEREPARPAGELRECERRGRAAGRAGCRVCVRGRERVPVATRQWPPADKPEGRRPG